MTMDEWQTFQTLAIRSSVVSIGLLLVLLAGIGLVAWWQHTSGGERRG